MSRLDHARKNEALRKARVRSTVSGTPERPRMAVHLSNRAVTVQVIDDTTGKTLVTSSSINLKAAGSLSEKAAIVGKDIATKSKKAKITKVAFDRNGRSYQKRLTALADAARENGLEF